VKTDGGKGEVGAWRKIRSQVHVISQIAAFYFISSKKMQDKLMKSGSWNEQWHNILVPDFNRPVSQNQSKTIQTEQFNEYTFVTLRNSLTYQKASRDLGNCLDDYRLQENQVFGILHKNKYVGTVEIRDGYRVVEALIRNNKPIEDDENIFRAYTLWGRKNNLVSNDGSSF